MELGSRGEGVAYARGKKKRCTKPFKEAKLTPAELPGGSLVGLRRHFASAYFDETVNWRGVIGGSNSSAERPSLKWWQSDSGGHGERLRARASTHTRTHAHRSRKCAYVQADV